MSQRQDDFAEVRARGEFAYSEDGRVQRRWQLVKLALKMGEPIAGMYESGTISQTDLNALWLDRGAIREIVERRSLDPGIVKAVLGLRIVG